MNAPKVTFLKSKTKKKPLEDATEVPEMISNYLSTTILNHIFQNHDIQVHSGSFYKILEFFAGNESPDESPGTGIYR